MIADALNAALTERFPAKAIALGIPPDPIAVIPAQHPKVGDVRIWADSEEATVAIGTLTHGHFNPYDDRLTDDEVAQYVVERVVEFLQDLFADRVLLWVDQDRRAGGWRVLDTAKATGLLPDGRDYFFWSGPVASSP